MRPRSQASKFSLSLPLLITGLVGSFSAHAFSSGTFSPDHDYGESVNNSWETFQPHANPIIYGPNLPSVLTGPFTYSTVETDSSPVPYILARSNVYAPNGENLTRITGSLLYSFDVFGPSSSLIPVKYQAKLGMSGQDLLQQGGQYPGLQLQARSSISISVQNPNGASTTGISYAADCRNRQCSTPVDEARGNSALFDEVKYTPDSYNVNLNGSIFMLTDSTGHARADIVLAVATSAFKNIFNSQITFRSTAYADPYFYIDPAWLADHPGSSLIIPEGVGNQVSSVPVPTAAWLFGSGLLGLLGLKRQRQA